ncbi:MAG: 5-deoxy-glucuronate isomerase, partial [Candidatus Eremiobacteraeota bacterium]|nr:5-deoxy-glucuronate isomerase [Candidatus Eremiobacteraeota bacterium]
MSKLLIRSRDTGQSGVFAEVSAAEAGWDFLNMAALRLFAGETYRGSVGEHEHISVVLGGRCLLTVAGERFELGGRADVFSGMPHAFYLPRGKQFELEALSEMFEIVSCWVPSDQDFPISIIRPEQCAVELRGGGNASRQINSILPPGSACHRLVCVEVYTPSGNWSSYPPHKHDQHRVDEHGNLLEADLEEIYFYKLTHPQGFAYQRVYTGDGCLDELCLARHHDLVLVPEGYHPVVSGPGYHTYYCNFLAGSAQSLANSDDPEHA